MNNRIVVSLAVLSLLGLGGCSSPPPPKVAAPECVFPNSTSAAPGWVCDMPVEGASVTAVGISAKSNAGVAFMKQMAMADARVQLAQTVRIRVSNMIKQYAETTGAANQQTVDQVNTSVTKQITDETLVGTKLLRTITGPDGAMYALVGLDEMSAQQITEVAIRSSMNNDRAAWQQFRAQKSQDELAADIAKQKVGQ
ncbi:MAG: LPP20 family lipoprotein [Sideroxydans sp.]